MQVIFLFLLDNGTPRTTAAKQVQSCIWIYYKYTCEFCMKRAYMLAPREKKKNVLLRVIIHITLSNTRRCRITNIFWGLGRNNGRHNSAKCWVPDTETTKYTVHIHVWNRSEAFRAKHAMSYTGCRNLGD